MSATVVIASASEAIQVSGIAEFRLAYPFVDVTSDLPRRVFEHRRGLLRELTQRDDGKPLVRYEGQPTMPDAVAREKQIEGGSRKAKLRLIEARIPS